MSRVMLAALAVIAAAMLLGTLDRQSAAVTEKHVRIGYEAKRDVRPEDLLVLTKPIGCGTWVVTQADRKRARKYENCIDSTRTP